MTTATPSFNPQMMLQQQQEQHMTRIRQSFVGFRRGTFHNKLFLALTSALPNEVDWALNTLLQMTYYCEEFVLSEAMILLEALFEVCEPWCKMHVYAAEKIIPLTVYDASAYYTHPERTTLPAADLQRAIQVFGICQNLCLNEKNVTILVRSGKFMEILYKGLTSTLVIIRNCALSLLESIAPFYALRAESDVRKEPLYMSCVQAIFSDDYHVVLTSLRFLTNLTNIEQNERILFGDPHFVADVQSIDDYNFSDLPGYVKELVQRLGHLLYSGDQPLIYESLEYLYAITKLGDFMTARVVQALKVGATRPAELHPTYKVSNGGVHFIDALVHFVCRQHVKLLQKEKPSYAKHEPLPIHEPQRCVAWFQKYFAAAQHSNMTGAPPFLRQHELYHQYAHHVAALLAQSPLTTPALSVAEFVHSLATAFPEARINYVMERLPNGASQMTPIVLNVVRNKEPMVVKKRKRKATSEESQSQDDNAMQVDGEETEEAQEVEDPAEAWKKESITCCWEEGGELCSHVSEGLEEFKTHLLETHRANQDATQEEEEGEEDGKLRCHWRSCSRFHNVTEEVTEEEWLVHVLTHAEKRPFSTPASLQSLKTLPKLSEPQSSPDAPGVPLTAALILKNIARFDARLLMPYEKMLATIAFSSHNCARYAADILQECTKQHAVQVAADLSNEAPAADEEQESSMKEDDDRA